MATLTSKEHVEKELEKAGIEICLTRKIGYNAHRLVYESFGHFVVNAKAGTAHDHAQIFAQTFGNITISINN